MRYLGLIVVVGFLVPLLFTFARVLGARLEGWSRVRAVIELLLSSVLYGVLLTFALVPGFYVRLFEALATFVK